MLKLRTLIGVFLRSATTRGRMLGLLGLGVFAVGLAAVVRSAPDSDPDAAGNLIDTLGLALILPVAALLVATATLGQLRSDQSLIYLWLRPVSRFSIAAAAWIAAMLITLPTVALPVVATAAVAGGSSDLVGATLLATILGLAAYNGIFVALGLLTRHAAIWGLVYILVWEGLLAALGSGINRLAFAQLHAVHRRVGRWSRPASGQRVEHHGRGGSDCGRGCRGGVHRTPSVAHRGRLSSRLRRTSPGNDARRDGLMPRDPRARLRS